MMRELFITGTIMTEQTFILGKDAALEDSISKFQQKLTALGFNIEEASWLNPVPNVSSIIPLKNGFLLKMKPFCHKGF